jgi:hypothetical protein
LLCRHHGRELEIPLYHTHRFLNRDYIVFDCGGMALSQARIHASTAVISVRSNRRLDGAGVRASSLNLHFSKLHQSGSV